jgi:HK97 family phage major capsid protein
MPTRPTQTTPAEFSLVAFVRSLLKDAELRPNEGNRELAAVAAAGKQFAGVSGTEIRGHVLPVTPSTRAEAGGINTGSLATGGALISGSITLAEALQPVLQIERIGARRIEGGASDSLVSPPAAVSGWWLGEDQDAPVSEMLLGAAMLLPKEAAVRLRMSRRLFKQAGAIAEQEFRNLMRRSIAETVESGILAGSGSLNEPMGIINDPQLRRTPYNGSFNLPPSDEAAAMAGVLAEKGADIDSLHFLLPAVDYADSQNLVTSAGQGKLIEITDNRRRMAGIPCSFSPYIPSGTLILADWSRVVVSYVGPPQLIVDPYSQSESGTLLMTLFQQVSYAIERRDLVTVGINQS